MLGSVMIRDRVRARPRRNGRARPTVENLEGRALMAAAMLHAARDRVFDLMDSVALNVTTDMPATAYQIQERSAGAGPWVTVATTQMTNFVLRLAGRFEFRAVATINGAMVNSPILRDFEVRFPTFATITADAAVQRATDAAWAETRTFADDNKGAPVVVMGVNTYPNSMRREEGFWVQIDTATGRYQNTATVFGRTVGPGDTASVDLGARPADRVAGDGKSAVYTVASFHTHSPMTYRITLNARGQIVNSRGVGPSVADGQADRADDVPGIVYDYTAQMDNSIPGGWPLNSAAQRYHSGNHRRQNV